MICDNIFFIKCRNKFLYSFSVSENISVSKLEISDAHTMTRYIISLYHFKILLKLLYYI